MATSAGGRLEAKAKHYILAAFTAGFIAAAVVTVVFVVMSPAHLSFSITDARYEITSDHDHDMPRLFLALAVHNPSRRAAVQYRSIFVDLSNNNGSQWLNWMRANVSPNLPLDQPRRSVKRVNAMVSRVGPAADFLRTSPNFITVTITAVARFKVGVAWTRLYDIKVYCGNVDFFLRKEESTTAVVDCLQA